SGAAAVPFQARPKPLLPGPVPLAARRRGALGQSLHATPRDLGLLASRAAGASRGHQGRPAVLSRLALGLVAGRRPPAQEGLRQNADEISNVGPIDELLREVSVACPDFSEYSSRDEWGAGV